MDLRNEQSESHKQTQKKEYFFGGQNIHVPHHPFWKSIFIKKPIRSDLSVDVNKKKLQFFQFQFFEFTL